MPVSGRILVLSVVAITAVSTLFCLIGLATKGWYSGNDGTGLFCDGCRQPPKALSIISFILLIVTVVAFVLLMFEFLRGPLLYIPAALLFVSTIFLLATFTSSVSSDKGYSFNLMVAAHFFSYVALAAAAYWYGQTGGQAS